MKSARTYLFLVSVLLASWLGMQAVYEAGHVVGAQLTGGKVVHFCIHPLTLAHTELSANPHPLVVVWAGPVGGVLVPLFAWGVAIGFRCQMAFLLRFFAG